MQAYLLPPSLLRGCGAHSDLLVQSVNWGCLWNPVSLTPGPQQASQSLNVLIAMVGMTGVPGKDRAE